MREPLTGSSSRPSPRVSPIRVYLCAVDARAPMAYTWVMVFIETPAFTESITALVSDEGYRALQNQLALNPDAGDVVQGTGGIRKIRIALPGKGKSGGARVLYFRRVAHDQIIFLFAFTKNEQANLTAAQKKDLKKVVENWR